MSRINGFVGRRNFLKIAGIGGASIATFAAGSELIGRKQEQEKAVAATQPAENNTAKVLPVNPDEAFKRLMDGNKRFVAQKRTFPDQSAQYIRSIAKAQHPFTCILGCADSRVASEIIFDQGLGDIFDVRLAGNIANDAAIGSLEYAVAHLGCQLIVILGHESCGAVKAAVQEDKLPGRIGFVVEEIRPAVAKVKAKSGDIVEEAVISNIKYQLQRLQESSVMLSKYIQEGKLKLIGARYDLDTGAVSIVS